MSEDTEAALQASRKQSIYERIAGWQSVEQKRSQPDREDDPYGAALANFIDDLIREIQSRDSTIAYALSEERGKARAVDALTAERDAARAQRDALLNAAKATMEFWDSCGFSICDADCGCVVQVVQHAIQKVEGR